MTAYLASSTGSYVSLHSRASWEGLNMAIFKGDQENGYIVAWAGHGAPH